MKKEAFTLAELLITLGIIGVIGALMLPAINKLRPDENKTMYLKVYDELSKNISAIASNSKIYPACKKDAANAEDPGVLCQEYPLLNTNASLIDTYSGNAAYQGKRKLCSFLALSMGGENANCTEDGYNYTDATFKNNLSFTTPNGMQWRVVPQLYSTDMNTQTAQYRTDIYVDINPKNNDNDSAGQNCIYDQNNCKTPDIFKFMVSADGIVHPADPVGKKYILGRKTLLKKDFSITDHNIETGNNATYNNIQFVACDGLTQQGRCKAEGNFWIDGACYTELEKLKNCLDQISLESDLSAGIANCGLKVNYYTQDNNFGTPYATITFREPVASNITWTPVFENGYRGASCMVPIGSTSCSVTKQSTSAKIYTKGDGNNPGSYLLNINPKLDTKYTYIHGNIWAYLKHKIYNR